jgi:hypothetical protein
MKTSTQSRPLLATGASIPTLPLIHVELELSPMDKKSDYRLYLVIEPLKITYDAVSEKNGLRIFRRMFIFQPTINQIIECFDPNDDKLESTLPEFVFEN